MLTYCNAIASKNVMGNVKPDHSSYTVTYVRSETSNDHTYPVPSLSGHMGRLDLPAPLAVGQGHVTSSGQWLLYDPSARIPELEKSDTEPPATLYRTYNMNEKYTSVALHKELLEMLVTVAPSLNCLIHYGRKWSLIELCKLTGVAK